MRGNFAAALASLGVAAAMGAANPAEAAPPSDRIENGKQAGDFMVRLRGIYVVPDEDSHIGTIGGEADISNELVPEVDFTYFITDHLALELIAATAKHDVEAKNTAVGDLDLGSVWVLPPTLTLQYHVMPDGIISPYFGAGVNYTLFYGKDTGDDIDGITYDNHSFGFALQVGTDISLAENLYLNFDVKKVWIDTDAEVRALGTTVDARVDVDPWIIGVGLGYKF